MIRADPGGDVPSIPGSPIRLTLDADIQNRALEVFGEDSGAAVMMDCRTGDLLCLFSAPSFDANRFVKGLTAVEYQALAQYERKPLFNKALTATYPPGSDVQDHGRPGGAEARHRSEDHPYLQPGLGLGAGGSGTATSRPTAPSI